ncbi:MAG: hypothetical protein ABIT76_11405 [Chthoniobacterales bacterium]
MTPTRRRYLSWILIGLPVFLLIAALIVLMQAKAFLRSDRFRAFLSGKVSHTVRAQGAFRPLQWTESSFYSDAYTATGEAGGPLESIDAEQVRASVNLQGLWERKWQVEHVEIERLALVPSAKKMSPPKEAPKSEDDQTAASAHDSVTYSQSTESPIRPKHPEDLRPKTPGFIDSLLPNQVDVQRVSVSDFTLDGKHLRVPFRLQGLKVEATPDGKAWNLTGSGGSAIFEKRPKISINDVAVRYADKTYFITRSAFTVEGGGSATITGKINERANSNTDLNGKFDKLPAATILPKDWRARLHGQLSADLHAVGDGQSLVVSGPVTLTNGELEALPVLDQVALFTRTQRFRQLHLEAVHADVEIRDGRVKISNLDAESSGLVRMTGGFVIENGIMTGEFLVGVTPASLRWIPGSQTKVFTDEHGGYLWTPMKVTGPLAHMTEDLSERLAVAAGQELIDTIQKDPSKLKDTLKDAAESLLDFFKK